VPTPRPDITTVARPSPVRRTQTTLTLVALAAAIIWCVFHAARGDQSIYNPAPLHFAHKNFEQQCYQCHDGGTNGLISQRVSDTACLKCHSASIHSGNQKMGVAHSHADLVVAITGDNTYPNGMRSSDCMACHVEHKGDEALEAKSDQECSKCHDNLKDHATNPIVVQNSVIAFAKDKHPDFGRQLLKDGKFIDPTVLKFNHQFHTQQGVSKDCTICHKPSADKRYMLPVSYQDSCESCHHLNVLAGVLGVKIKHQDLVKVRQEIEQLPGIYLDRITTTANSKELRFKGTLPTVPVRKAQALAKAKEGVDLYSYDEFTQKQLTIFSDQLNKLNPTYPQLQHLHEVLGAKPAVFAAATQTAAKTTTLQAPNRNLLEYYIVFEAQNRCVLCHDVSGELPAVYSAKQSTGQASAPMLLSTAPTNESHRLKTPNPTPEQMEKSCKSCHDNVYDSIVNCITNPKDAATKKTNPIQWDTDQLAETSRLLTPTGISSCSSCHNPPASAGHTASSSCVTCHDYHDRKLERSPSAAANAVAASP
jgi:hypothetical protein